MGGAKGKNMEDIPTSNVKILLSNLKCYQDLGGKQLTNKTWHQNEKENVFQNILLVIDPIFSIEHSITSPF